MALLHKALGSLSLVTDRLALATLDEEEQERAKEEEEQSLVLLFMILYGASAVMARSLAIKWAGQYTAAEIKRQIFQRVLVTRVKNGVDLISTMTEADKDRLLQDLFKLGQGKRTISPEAVQQLLEQKYSLESPTAKLIAQDQSQKYRGSTQQATSVARGQSNYIWWTRLDDRVRPTHQANHGRKFNWLHPPPGTGHPGWEINCRCVALPT